MTTLGASFLNRYRALRKNEGDRDLAIEIEYNFGRAFHGLGQFQVNFAHTLNVMLINTRNRCVEPRCEALSSGAGRGGSKHEGSGRLRGEPPNAGSPAGEC